ncbi:MAG: cell division protein FtsZ [Thermoleophilaceae bacterium]|jgi:cell division protein FtsZ
MREGPLADLFRRTDGHGAGGEEPKEEAGARPREEQADDAVDFAERPRPAAPEQPSSGPAEPEVEPAEAPVVRGPKERLRTAFSPDIPENILERPSSVAIEPERPRYGREEPSMAVGRPPVLEPVLRVVGVGGAGVNAVERMLEAEVEGIDFVAVNTDLQSLQGSSAQTTIHIGSELTRGLGSGSNPELGRQSAIEDFDRIKAAVKGSDMVFIAAGEGGGTGTGAAPVVARIAREVGALAVGIVTKPFGFEGTRRSEQAERGVEELADEVDTLIVIPNSRLLTVLDRQTSMVDAFRMADDVLRQGVQGISDLITLPGLINLDFADVRTIMSDAGQALLGIGMGTGEHRAMDAAARAVASPLLDTSVEGARAILLSITGGTDLSLWEVNEAARAVAEVAHPQSNIIFGAMVDEKLEDQVWITVVATGYGERPAQRRSEGGRAAGSAMGVDRSARRDRPAREAAREADREPRVIRTPRTASPAPSAARASRVSDGLGEIDIPEFIPRA